MLERIVEWCAHRRGVVLVVALCFGALGAIALKQSPLDAIPDLTDTQVIIWTEWMGQSPQLVEDQITYPLVTSFISAPRVKTVRGFSMFGMSFVYILFEDGTDQYWARSRTLEYLSQARGQLPEGVNPVLGPDATASGWIFMYVLQDPTGQHDLQELRAFQDFTLRYALATVPGVSEVASVGGFEKQYQIVIDPAKLLAYGITVSEVVSAARMSNQDVGGRVVEWVGREYIFRGLGYVTKAEDLEQVVVSVNKDGIPLRIKDLGRVEIGPDIRRGLAEWNGEGEAVGGIVVMRGDENALDVIDAVKKRLEQLRPAFPAGIEVKIAYDRSDLIRRSIATLGEALTEEIIIVLLFIAVFLMHLRSALVAVIVLPLAVLLSFIATYLMRVTVNIMSLGGIIIAVGDMVDAVVVLVENAHHRLERQPDESKRESEIVLAAKELARPTFGSLLVIAVSFLPVFALTAQEGRLFHPLAYTKTFAMVAAAILSITLAPALMVWLIKGKLRPQAANPINRVTMAAYRPVLRWILHHRKSMLIGAAILMASAVWPLTRIGSEFMPPLDEGSYLFMPVTFPNISIEEAKRTLQLQDKIIKSFPEVESVFGKAGRAETPTDSAPLSMFETVIVLKPRSKWRSGMTPQRLEEELTKALEFPGIQGALTMPIKARIDMLTTGIRTPVGIKIYGEDLARNEAIGKEIELRLRDLPGTRSVYADRETLGAYVDYIPDRAAIARYGLRLMDVLETVETAIGGMVISQTIEGRQRFSINVRYPRELRSDLGSLERVLVPIRGGPSGMEGMGAGVSPMRGASALPVGQVPLAQLGQFVIRPGPPMIKDENASLVSYVFIDTTERDLGGYVERAKAALHDMDMPPGYRLEWTGQYEFLVRVRERMQYLIPLTLILILGILYFEFEKLSLTLLVMLSLPFAAIGGLWLLYVLDFNTSVAVWVGMIALIGVAAETASIMVVYLEKACEQWRSEGRIQTVSDLIACVLEEAVLRARPIIMAVGMNVVGLIPIMIASGAGADVTKRMASPMIGGLFSLTILTLALIPCVYVVMKARSLPLTASESEPS